MRWLLLVLLGCASAEPAPPPVADPPVLKAPTEDTGIVLAQEDPEPTHEEAVALELEKYEHIFQEQVQQQDQLQTIRGELDSLSNYIADKKAAKELEVVWCRDFLEQPPMEAYEVEGAPSTFIGPECPPPLPPPVPIEVVVPLDPIELLFDASLHIQRRQQ